MRAFCLKNVLFPAMLGLHYVNMFCAGLAWHWTVQFRLTQWSAIAFLDHQPNNRLLWMFCLVPRAHPPPWGAVPQSLCGWFYKLLAKDHSLQIVPPLTLRLRAGEPGSFDGPAEQRKLWCQARPILLHSVWSQTDFESPNLKCQMAGKHIWKSEASPPALSTFGIRLVPPFLSEASFGRSSTQALSSPTSSEYGMLISSWKLAYRVIECSCAPASPNRIVVWYNPLCCLNIFTFDMAKVPRPRWPFQYKWRRPLS